MAVSDAPDSHGSHQLTQYRLGMIEETLQRISENLERLAALEQKHIETRDALNRSFSTLEKIDGRLRVVENEMPTLKLARGWIISGVVGIVSLLGVALFKLFTISAT